MDEARHVIHHKFEISRVRAHIAGARKPYKIHNYAIEPVNLVHHHIGGLAVFASFGKALAEVGGVALDGA